MSALLILSLLTFTSTSLGSFELILALVSELLFLRLVLQLLSERLVFFATLITFLSQLMRELAGQILLN